MPNTLSSLIHPNQRAEAMHKENEAFLKKIKEGDWTSQKMEGKNSLGRLEVAIFKILNLIIKLFNEKYGKMDQLFAAHEEIKTVQAIQRKVGKLHIQNSSAHQPPYITVGEKLNLVASKARFQALKAEISGERIRHIKEKNGLEVTDKFLSLPQKLQRVIRNIAELQGKDSKHLADMLAFLDTLHDLSGSNVYAQIEKLLAKKQALYWDFSVLTAIADKCSAGTSLADLKNDVAALDEKSRKLLLQGEEIEKISPQLFLERLHKLRFGIEKSEIPKIVQAFEDILKKVDRELAIYEISPQRLTEEMSDDILKKPIHVTMVAAEAQGLIKEGGLAEAVQGMAKGLKEQNPGNTVRLIIPKYHPSEDIKKICEGAPLVPFSDRAGKVHHAYKVNPPGSLEGVELYLVDDPSFEVKEGIYGEGQMERFPTFSGLAADLIKQLSPTDVIHLHDWHVAGVGLRLKADDPKSCPPILFTYHNNNRGAQGRVGSGAYNYEPIIQGLIKSGIAAKDTNVMVDVLKAADAVTTVSETFGIESQMPGEKKGEGISFAVREAAESGKLTGIINGSSPAGYNPETSKLLERFGLNYKPDSPNILEQKKGAKKQLEKWVQTMKEAKETRTPITGEVDFSKPLITFIGRFDTYQKGLDKLDEAIQATLKSGGQFVIMGLDQGNKEANKILDSLQKKYPQGVLFIRDYKERGNFHYQSTIGDVVRAATEFVFIPSSYEPCGLVQFEGWLYGSLAIGSNTGGLADTIVPPGRPGKPFNGFLFEREGNREMSLAKIIPQALNSWMRFSDDEKRAKIKEVILTTRKRSWTDTSSGYSPVELYRFAYENARRRVALRGLETSHHFSINPYYEQVREKSRIPTAPQVTKEQKQEEEYLRLYYSNKADSDLLDEAYQKLSPGWRKIVPSPYGKNVNDQLYQDFGAHFGKDHTRFKMHAPEAKIVQLKIVNQGTPSLFRMEKTEDGSWSYQCRVPVGTQYQYLLDGQATIDPFGLQTIPGEDVTKAPYSIVTDRNGYKWQDKAWIEERRETAGKPKPMSVYEVHPTSWKKRGGQPLNYRELGEELVKHCQKTGHTHVELMGALDYFCDKSWGNCYQVTGFYAPHHRLGSAEDFKSMVDHLHGNKIGIILDFVPAHFAPDVYALAANGEFDKKRPSFFSSPREYIIEGMRQTFFKWGTKFFDLEKKRVREFLISSASYWLKEMHIDGLRVDAVRAMLFSDSGERPKIFGNTRHGALFLKDFNAVVHQKFPGVVTIAEDYSYSGTTHSYVSGGLGFDYKWHVGWMKKVLDFFSKPSAKRRASYDLMVAAAKEDHLQRQWMALSHDESKEEMRSLLEKTPGLSTDEKFANLRLMLSFMMCLPGKKLMMMGSEFGVQEAWTDFFKKESGLADSPQLLSDYGQKTMAFVKAFNDLYRTSPALFEQDHPKALEWIMDKDPYKQVIAYRRTSEKESVVCLHNFTNQPSQEVKIKAGQFVEVLSSDGSAFGGKAEVKLSLKEGFYTVTVPPLATIVIKEKYA